MTNHRRRRQSSATRHQEATGLVTSRARDILSSEAVTVRDALVAGRLLGLAPKVVLG